MNHNYKPGINKVTIKDIAKRAGISPRSVSMVLNNTGRISQATRKKVLEIAKEMNYQPNILAKGLVNGKTYLIGVVFPYLTSSFFTNIISKIEEESLLDGYDIILGNSSSSLEAEKGAIQRMLNRRVDGIICCPDPRYYEFYNYLVETNIPLIQIMTHVNGVVAYSVLVDDEKGGYLATKHLIDLGHKKIGFLSYNEYYYSEIILRNKGYRNALIEHGIKLDVEKYEIKCDLSIQGSYTATKALLERNPQLTAIFAPTDMAAIGTIQACIDNGKKVPDDISVVGYDDIDLAKYQIGYPLTTIAQPKDIIGTIAFKMLKDLIRGEKIESVLLEPELVVRNTTKELTESIPH